MNKVLTIARELWSLFVDDGSLAMALVIWCAVVGLIVPRLVVSREADAVILFLGCLAILLFNVAAATRHHSGISMQNANAG
jgi:hypothetical protein